MDKNKLKAAFDKSGSDKSSTHKYESGYAQILPESVSNLLEIGIANGYATVSSLTAWAELYPNAQIVGADIVPEKMINTRTIRSFLVDQSSRDSLEQFKSGVGMQFDVIIDDGSHYFMDALLTYEMLFDDLLKNDGIYIIEDIGKEGSWAQMKHQWEAYMITVDQVTYGFIDTRPEISNDDSLLLWIKKVVN